MQCDAGTGAEVVVNLALTLSRRKGSIDIMVSAL